MKNIAPLFEEFVDRTFDSSEALSLLRLTGCLEDDRRFNPENMRTAKSQLFLFPASVKRDPAIDVWMQRHAPELRTIAQQWFQAMRDCGDDVRELLHDEHPTACVGEAAFAYVNAFKGHVNVGFFRGAELADPEHLLEGTGKLMRHVKLRPEGDVSPTALLKLIKTAYVDMKRRLKNA